MVGTNKTSNHTSTILQHFIFYFQIFPLAYMQEAEKLLELLKRRYY